MKAPEVRSIIRQTDVPPFLLAKLLLMPLVIALPMAVCAQATVNFANLSPQINIPVFLPDGVTKVPGPKYSAMLLAGPTPGNLMQIAVTPFLTNAPGYFNGGIVFVPTGAPGSVAFLQVQFWNTEILNQIVVPEWYFYHAFLGQSPVFTAVLPAVLSGLGTGPLILNAPRLEIHLPHTNTVQFTLTSPSSGYLLFTEYLLEQSPSLNETKWTIDPPLSFGLDLPRPDGNMFYRVVPR